MKKELYLIISHEIDTESASNALIGVYCTMDVAIAQMRDVIYHKFEDIKEWWEETDEEEDSSEEQYQEWIDDNFLDDQHTLWSYTDDDPVEHTFKIHHIEVDSDESMLYALICTRVDGVENTTELLGIYDYINDAGEALIEFELNVDRDSYYDIVTSVEEFTVI
jgi:hypothetical protein